VTDPKLVPLARPRLREPEMPCQWAPTPRQKIMSVQEEHPAWQARVGVTLEDIHLDKQGMSNVGPDAGEQITSASLREALAKRLRDSKIPGTFISMEALPLTSNGKVDRAALPVPDANNTIQDEVIGAPGTPLEERLAGIVTDLLKLEQINIDDNFFMLGGHSLLGTQLIARVGETFGVALSLRSLFGAPTIRLLSSEIEQQIIATLETMSDEEALRLLEQGHSA